MAKIFTLLLALFVTSAWAAQPAAIHPFSAVQPESAPQEARLVVEIPAGSFTKYEIGAADGLLHVDRFLSMPVAYPANYGSMPRTRAGDGDPLDALVLTRAPLYPGSVIQFRPIAVLRMVDKGEMDEKIIGVPVDKLDSGYTHIRDIADLAPMELQRIEAFFRYYKQLPESNKADVELHGWGDAVEARRLIEAAIQSWKQA